MQKIAFFEIKDSDQEFFRQRLSGRCEMVFISDKLSVDNVGQIHDVSGIVVFIYSHIDSQILDKLPQLKFIATMSTGVDHIDLEACKAKNILVSNIPSYGENTVAEHAFALILAISRRLVESFERVKRGEFSPEGLSGFDLKGKTIGVIGVGNIGKHVVRMARGFEMNVIAYKRTPDPKLAEELGFSFVDLDVLFSQSDIISLHIPYSQDAHHFLNDERFSKMKDGVIIINTARGGLIDTSALLKALESYKVSWAGLDVLEEEPLLREEMELLSKEFDREALLRALENHMLLRHPRVVVTPHNAFNSKEALERIMKTTEENIIAFLNGSSINIV